GRGAGWVLRKVKASTRRRATRASTPPLRGRDKGINRLRSGLNPAGAASVNHNALRSRRIPAGCRVDYIDFRAGFVTVLDEPATNCEPDGTLRRRRSNVLHPLENPAECSGPPHLLGP